MRKAGRGLVRMGHAEAHCRTGSEKLSGEEKYRLRQGDYRVLYSIDDKAMTVTIMKIEHRREIYRG